MKKKFRVRYQQHRYSDYSDNPNPREWVIRADSAEHAFMIAQQRGITERAKGRKIGHVFREVLEEDGNIVVAEGNYLS